MRDRVHSAHGRRAVLWRSALTAVGVVALGALVLIGFEAIKDSGKMLQASPQQAQARRVFIDPVTGERRLPTAVDIQQSRRTAPTEPVPMQVVHRDGMTFLKVPPERRMQLRVQLDAQGSPRSVQGDGHE